VRKVLIAIVLLIVLVWLIPWDLQPDGEIQVPPPVAPVVTSPATSSTEQADSGRAHVAPESAPDVAEPPAPRPQAPATTPARALQMWDQGGLIVPRNFRENEKAFMVEVLDPLWSRSREAEIRSAIAQINGFRWLTIEVECRTSMCRLQSTQNVPVPPTGPDPIYTELLARLGYEPRLLGMARDINAGTVTYLTYLPRQ
jgi:hypothetical protein